MSEKGSLRDEIDDALVSHIAWKQRLRTAALSSETALPVEKIASDGHCRFGQWLASVQPNEHHCYYLDRVTELHREFHLLAGAIAQVINDGDTAEGLKALNSAEYNLKSKELSAVLMEWRARC